MINLRGSTPSSALHLVVPGSALHFEPLQRNLRDESADRTLEKIQKGEISRWLLSWLPLMRGGAKRTVIDGWLHQINRVADKADRATMAAFTRIFAVHAGKLDEWETVLEGWNMEESPVILELIRTSEARGEARGELRGEARGRMELQKTILDLGRMKFGRVNKQVKSQIEAIDDLAKLADVARRVMKVDSWRELLESV